MEKYPNRIQFLNVEDEKEVTLQEFDELANKVARWDLSLGYKQKDTVAIIMNSHPDFVSIWVGFAKIGVSAALLNTNVTGTQFVKILR